MPVPEELKSAEGTREEEAIVAEKDFDEAFSEASSNEPPEDKPVVVDAKKDDGKKDEEEPPAKTEEKKSEEEDYEHKYKTLQGIHKHDREVWEAEKADLLKKTQEREAAEATALARAEEDKKNTEAQKALYQKIYDNLTDEQKAQLKEYDEEFDMVSKMEGLKRELALKQMEEKLNAFKEEILSHLAPMGEFVAQTAEERDEAIKTAHFDYLKGHHADYEKLRDDGSVIKWIESKPVYLRDGMMKVYKEGTADQVVEMLDDYKQENNIPNQTQTDNVVRMERTRQRKQALTSPIGKKGNVNVSHAPASDFEAAFDEALNK